MLKSSIILGILITWISTWPLAAAFMPSKVGPFGGAYGGYTPGNTRTHAKQTEDEIIKFLRSQFNVDESDYTSSIKVARDAIILANRLVDDPDDPYDEKNTGKAHFDDETFMEGQERLNDLRSSMIESLNDDPPDVDTARSLLGRQLHTLQDFYAHSNWVELGYTVISPIIGFPGAEGYSATDSGTRTCADDCGNKDDPSYVASYTCANGCKCGDTGILQLAATFFCFFLSPSCQLPDCAANLAYTGIGMPVTSGYYQVESSNGSKSICSTNGQPSAGIKPALKCSHGGLSDTGAVGTEGINKDSEWAPYAPHGLVVPPDGTGQNWHQKAANLSQDATQHYFQYLVKDPSQNGQPALTDDQLRLLFGLSDGATLAVVVDTSRSMADVLPGIKQSINNIVNALQGTSAEPTYYVLYSYTNDYGALLGEDSEYPYASDFLDDVNALSVDTQPRMSSQCASYALGAVTNTLNNVLSHTNLLLFTDSAPTDTLDISVAEITFYDTVRLLADDLDTRFFFFLFSSACSACSNFDTLADDTGGQFFEISDRSISGDLAAKVLPYLDQDLVSLYQEGEPSTDPPLTGAEALADAIAVASAIVDGVTPSLNSLPGDSAADSCSSSGSGGGGGGSNTAKRRRKKRATTGQDETVSILVDSTMTSVTFASTGSSGDTLTITQPNGAAIQHGDAGVSYLSSSSRTLVTIQSPAPGTWIAATSSSSSTSTLSVVASSKLTFTSFSFVEIRGDAHPGYFPLNLSSLAGGTVYTVNADVEGVGSVDSFAFGSPLDVTILGSFTLTRLPDSIGNSAEHIWYGDVVAPCTNSLFNVYVFGTDLAGYPFQRLWPQAFNFTRNPCGNQTLSTVTNSSSTSSNTTSSSTSSTFNSTTSTVSAPYRNGTSPRLSSTASPISVITSPLTIATTSLPHVPANSSPSPTQPGEPSSLSENTGSPRLGGGSVGQGQASTTVTELSTVTVQIITTTTILTTTTIISFTAASVTTVTVHHTTTTSICAVKP